MTIWMFIGGLICLIIGAELLVRGASRLALSFGISPLVVGLTIVAFAPTKASTLGVGGVLLASMILAAAQGRAGFAELLIALFVFVTAPVSANMMAQAALHLCLPSKAPTPEDAVPNAARPEVVHA